MANELNIHLDPIQDTGLTLLGKVYNLAGTQQGSNVSMTETTAGMYTGTYSLTGLSNGKYYVRFQTTTQVYGDGYLYMLNGTEVTEEVYNSQGIESSTYTGMVYHVLNNQYTTTVT